MDADDWTRLAQLAELGVLSASLLHELRQPLMAIKALAQLRRHRGETDGGDLKRIIEHVVQIEELLDHYAGFGRVTETPLVFDLTLPVGRALDMLEHRKRQVAAALRIELEGPLAVHGRPEALRQVAVNLLQNAFDAVEGRKVREVAIGSARVGDQAHMWVQDSGPGIPEGLRHRLFEPFVTTKPPGRGTGLGLYIAHRMVLEASGQLDLHFPESGGTRVDILLPIAL